jgi:hypothetical protein
MHQWHSSYPAGVGIGHVCRNALDKVMFPRRGSIGCTDGRYGVVSDGYNIEDSCSCYDAESWSLLPEGQDATAQLPSFKTLSSQPGLPKRQSSQSTAHVSLDLLHPTAVRRLCKRHSWSRPPILQKQTKTSRVSNSCSFRLIVAHLPSRECALVFSITLAHNGRGQTARFATPSEADDATSNNVTDCLIARRRVTYCKVFHATLESRPSDHRVRDYKIDMRTSKCLDRVESLCRNLIVPKDDRSHTLDAVRLHGSCRPCGARPTL